MKGGGMKKAGVFAALHAALAKARAERKMGATAREVHEKFKATVAKLKAKKTAKKAAK